MGVISRFAVKFSYILDIIARTLVVGIMVLGVANVLTRQFGLSIPGTIEWTEFLAAMLIGLSLAYCGARSGHIFLELFFDKLPIKVQHVLKIIIDLFVMTFLSISFWRIIIYANDMRLTGQVSMTTKTPFYIFIYIVAFGLLAYALVTLGSMIDSLRKEVQK